MKKKLGVIFGGVSSEHEVSLASAKSVLEAVDRSRYEVTEIGIAKDGRWIVGKGALLCLLDAGDRRLFPDGMAQYLDQSRAELDSCKADLASSKGRLPEFADSRFSLTGLDVVFPVLHGTLGEDGTIQGLLAVAGVAVVGCGVLASAVAMDKALTKRLLDAVGIPQPRWLLLEDPQAGAGAATLDDDIDQGLGGYPVFVKPANAGSSVGITKVHNRAALDDAIREAYRHDRRVLIEQAITGRELEIGVLGDEQIVVSPVVAEIIPEREFYDYEAKYLAGSTRIELPVRLPSTVVEQIQSLARRAFRAIDGCGMARVDFFYETSTDRVVLNEINTIPGFTAISQYPALMNTAGFSYPQLIERLIELALKRHQTERRFRL